jgi:hypothetical protein
MDDGTTHGGRGGEGTRPLERGATGKTKRHGGSSCSLRFRTLLRLAARNLAAAGASGGAFHPDLGPGRSGALDQVLGVDFSLMAA